MTLFVKSGRVCARLWDQTAFSVLIGLMVFGTAGVVLADNNHGPGERRDGRGRNQHQTWARHEQEARGWHRQRRGYYYHEPQVIYAPPSVVYAPPLPPPGLTLVLPMDFR